MAYRQSGDGGVTGRERSGSGAPIMSISSDKTAKWWQVRSKHLVLVGGLAFFANSCASEINNTPVNPNLDPQFTPIPTIEVDPTLVGPEIPAEFVISGPEIPEIVEPLPEVSIWMPPTLEQALTGNGSGGVIPENLRGFDETIKIGFASVEVSISGQIDFLSVGFGDSYKYVFMARSDGGDLIWAKVGEGKTERFSYYPLHYYLEEFTGEDGIDYLRYVLDTENVDYVEIPDSENADIIWGGSDGALPIVVKDAIPLSNGEEAYLRYWDIKEGGWEVNKNVVSQVGIEDASSIEVVGDTLVALDGDGYVVGEYNQETGEWLRVYKSGLIGTRTLEIDPVDIESIATESTNHLRFVEAQGNFLPYGLYNVDSEFSDGSIDASFHLRFRGIIDSASLSAGTSTANQRLILFDIPHEQIDHDTNEPVLTGDIQYLVLGVPSQNSGAVQTTLFNNYKGSSSEDTRMTYSQVLDRLSYMQEGESVIIGIQLFTRSDLQWFIDKQKEMYNAIVEGEVINTDIIFGVLGYWSIVD